MKFICILNQNGTDINRYKHTFTNNYLYGKSLYQNNLSDNKTSFYGPRGGCNCLLSINGTVVRKITEIEFVTSFGLILSKQLLCIKG